MVSQIFGIIPTSDKNVKVKYTAEQKGASK